VNYADFLQSKQRVFAGAGITPETLPEQLYPWQAAIVRWALRKGRAAVFADCGLGKTFMQVSWAQGTKARTLFLAPLCVAEQTVAEAAKLGVELRYARDEADAAGAKLVITNYERIDKFDTHRYEAVVLDESSILKAFDGKTRTKLIAAFQHARYRLCCTATPSPNDISELGNHAEFLGLMTRAEFLATWFIKIDQGLRTTEHHGWRMKRHAVAPFYRWLASWAVAVRKPSDLGYPDDGYNLPPLTFIDHLIAADGAPVGSLFPELGLKGIQGRLTARRGSVDARVLEVARLASDDEQWIIWCGLNDESSAVTKAIPGAVDVQGSDSYEVKSAAVQRFVAGDIRVLVSKVKILGFGLNFQHCSRMAFLGLSDSYEAYYQAVRRCWRFGQTRPVEAHIVVSEAERLVVENVRKKEAAAAALAAELLTHMSEFERKELAA
jgi:superfamily II DNA or RNA helicase